MMNFQILKAINYKNLTSLLVTLFLINFFFLGVYKNDINSMIKFEIFVPKPQTKIFCIILTNPKNFLTKTTIVNNTWAAECDNHKFISVIPEFYLNLTDYSNKEPLEIEYPFNLLQPTGHKIENYKTLTDKIQLAYVDIYKYYGDYDWYLKADDDTYIFMDNLREFLMNKNSSMPISYGYNLKMFQSGGAGYVMSRSALNLLGSKMKENKTYCPNTGREDVDLANCFRKLNVSFGLTEDELGRERFHPYNITDNLRGTYYDWLYNLSLNPVKKGMMSSSNKTISYHYMSPDELIKTHSAWKMYQKLVKQNYSLDFHEYILNRFL